MDEFRVYSATTHLGYGFPEKSLKQALEWKPHVIVAQGTSTDPGPYYLGSGKSYTESIGVKRDLSLILLAAKEHNIPFITSVGGAGADIHLDTVLKLLNEITVEKKLKLRVAVISGEIDKRWLKKKIESGCKAKRLVNIPRFKKYLCKQDIAQSVRIVAQMGPEPIMKALDLNVDAVITGRALDLGLYLAIPLKRGFDRGLATHMAKSIECGAIAATPGSGSDGLFATLRKEYFLVKSPNPERKCTIASVAAHAFYERSDPSREDVPGGYLDISSAKFEQYDERTVKVSGSRWISTGAYTVKLEGVALQGYRTICIAGIRDPTAIRHIDEILENVRKIVENRLPEKSNYTLNYRVYGSNGVMGNLEPVKQISSHELCIIVDVVAKTQGEANGVCALTRSTLLHYGYPGRKTTAGNLAFPFSPSDIPVGEVYIFNIWHALPLDDPCEPFKMRVMNFPG